MFTAEVNFSISETRNKLYDTSLQFYSTASFLTNFRQAVCFIHFASLLTSSQFNHQ